MARAPNRVFVRPFSLRNFALGFAIFAVLIDLLRLTAKYAKESAKSAKQSARPHRVGGLYACFF